MPHSHLYEAWLAAMHDEECVEIRNLWKNSSKPIDLGPVEHKHWHFNLKHFTEVDFEYSDWKVLCDIKCCCFKQQWQNKKCRWLPSSLLFFLYLFSSFLPRFLTLSFFSFDSGKAEKKLKQQNKQYLWEACLMSSEQRVLLHNCCCELLGSVALRWYQWNYLESCINQ